MVEKRFKKVAKFLRCHQHIECWLEKISIEQVSKKENEYMKNWWRGNRSYSIDEYSAISLRRVGIC